ncbi:TetR/AcrR family transcriptional regulator [Streptomyces albus]|uniref:TetR/AcrR family transcriptional regulator n=1 Tax=Streptomyces albus TaxID=1888 RepID=UPI0024AE4586|nr:TetR/AcrR family transcriptional regulator [Streptomyces albus]MDI6411020.1 TetR/AcrR family transcriptional regulator [Streptomyces albus]
MARPKSFDVDQAVDAAMDAFWSKGYAATSAQDLVDSTGLGRGSLYNAFASKHGLFEAVLRRYDEELTSHRVAVLDGTAAEVRGVSAAERVRAVLMAVVEEETGGGAGPRRGCLAVNAAVELGGTDPEVTRLVGRVFSRMEDAFHAAVVRGQAAGEFDAGQDARDLARLLLNTMYGLRVLGRTAGRDALAGIVEGTLRAVSARPDGAPQSPASATPEPAPQGPPH